MAKYYYVIERVYFIYRLLLVFIITFSFLLFLYTVSWRYNRDYLHASIDILFYIMFYIINMIKKYFFMPPSYIQYKKVPIWTLPIIFSYAPGHWNALIEGWIRRSHIWADLYLMWKFPPLVIIIEEFLRWAQEHLKEIISTSRSSRCTNLNHLNFQLRLTYFP